MKAPLIGLGFAATIEDVKKMIDNVDLDGSGQIEFPEFLAVVKNSGVDPESASAQMTAFFKKLTNGEIGQKDLSFSQFVNSQKREKLMDAICSPKGTYESRHGTHMLNNIRLKVATEKADEFYKQYAKQKTKNNNDELSRIG